MKIALKAVSAILHLKLRFVGFITCAKFYFKISSSLEKRELLLMGKSVPLTSLRKIRNKLVKPNTVLPKILVAKANLNYQMILR